MASANHEKSAPYISATSCHAQRTRLLQRLQLGPVDTLTARSKLNILMPAARVKELKDLGYDIRTRRITLTDEHGYIHHGIALYYLPKAVTMLAA